MGRTTEGGRNIFEAAATFGYRGVKYFVENKGVPVTSTNVDNRTAAHIAAREGKLDVVKYLLGKNCSLLNATDNFGYTMYHLSVLNGALNIVEFLIDDQKVDPYESNKMYDGNTAVHLAAENGQLKVLRYLIEKKNCDINVLNDRGQPPVFLAAERRRTKIIKYVAEVLTNFVSITAIDYNQKNILFMSATIGDITIPKLLLTKYKVNINVNQRDDTGATAIFWAAKHGHFDFLKYIVSWQHADVNIGNNDGRTPLHEAAGEGHVFVTKYLIEQGANKTASDKNGMTPKDYTSNENVLNCFSKIGRKRAPRSVSYHHAAVQLMQSTAVTTTATATLCSRIPSMLPCSSADQVHHFGALSRVEGAVTLLSSLLVYFAGNRRAVFGRLLSPETVRRSRIDLSNAADAVYAAYDYED